VPAVVENDANAAAYGEWRAGAGRGLSSFVCLTLGTGVGGGIVLGGSLYRGATGFAGEIGPAVICADGPPCACGNRGCLEALIGARAIVRRARELYGASGGARAEPAAGRSPEELARAAARGDEVAARVFAETGRYLGIALANIVHILAPEAIAVGGGVAGAGEILFGPARETLRRSVMDDRMAEVRVVPAELGNRAAVLGSALLAHAEAAGAR
jgi:glucokinase